MKIVHIAAEFAPFAKAGGMADMVFGLTKAQVANHEVEVYVPHHSCGHFEVFEQITEKKTFNKFSYQKAKLENLTVILIHTDNVDDFDRKQIYGYQDDVPRYLRFTNASYELLKMQKNLLIHLHDWHAAFFAFINHELPTVFTIHNFSYTGATSIDHLLPYGTEQELSCLYEGDCYHLLKAGLLFSCQIVAVSPTYAKEILDTPNLLQPALRKNADKLSGIINGIDTEYWNPATDPYLSLNYTSSSLEKKTELKRLIKHHFGIQEKKGFVATIIARLVYQKGPEFILEACKIIQSWGGGLILLIASEDPIMKKKFLDIQNDSTYIEFTFNETSAHLAYSAADLLLMPSIFEPCGLCQLIAMRYGTVPFVSFTGGLCDTVIEGETGFFFKNQNLMDFRSKLHSVLNFWENHREKWHQMQLNGMSKNVSWNQSVQEYQKVYTKALASFKQ